MSRERDNYRLVLEGVIEAFPNKPFPTLGELAGYLHKDVRTLKKDKNLMKLRRNIGNKTHFARESIAYYMSCNLNNKG